jgi:hypothetical protein
VADYTFDSANFFGQIPLAKAAAEAAFADLNAALNQNLGAIESSDQTITGTFNGNLGQASATVTFSGTVNNPGSEGPSTVSVPFVQNESQIRLYLGAKPLAFNSQVNVLGRGGPGGWGWNVTSASGFTNSDIANAVADAESQANEIYGRGGGPLVLNVSGNLTGGGATIPVSIDFGLGHGSVTFDSDTNNNNVDDLSEGIDPGDFFHFDHTTPPAPGKTDFYSVALHEAIHAIGLGNAAQWDGLVSGTSWMGTEVIDYLGSGAGVIDPDFGHIANISTNMSPRITDGAMQQSVLVPQGFAGERTILTELDLAFFRDMGFTNATVPPRPELGDYNADGTIDLDDVDFFRGNLGLPAGTDPRLDLNNDGTIDLADHDLHITNFVTRPDGSTGSIVGDVILDGKVDVLNDAAQLFENLGRPGVFGYSDGDLNADGTVDVLNDGARLIDNIGQSVSSSVILAAVPEPNASGLVALLALVMSASRRR